MFRRTAIWMLVVLIVFCGAVSGYAEEPHWGTRGPYVDEVWMIIITDPEAQLLAFRRGEVHVYPGVTRPSDIALLAASPEVDVTVDPGFHLFHLSLNLRRAPLDDVALRRAMAHLVDRDELVLTLFDGYVLPAAEFVPPASPFHNPAIDVATYNPARARAILDAAGYVMGEGGVRLDPATGQPLRTMVLYTVPSETTPTSTALAHMMAERFRAEGIPVEVQTLDVNTLIERIYASDPATGDRNFDMFLLAYTLGRFPTHLYTSYHSDFDVPGGNNLVGLRNPAYDAAAERVWRPRDLDEAYAAAYEAQRLLAELQPIISVYSRPFIDAFRSDIVTGYVQHVGYGAASNPNSSPWTVLNIRRVDQPDGGGSIRWLLKQEVGTLNPVLARSAYDLQVLGFVFDSLISVDPVTNEDYPWLAQEWEVSTWVDEEGNEGSVITYRLAPGVTWHDGVPFTAHDVKFTMDFLRDRRVPGYQAIWQEYSHAVVHDDLTVSVYYKTVSYWHTYSTAAFLPRHIWEGVDDFESFQPWRVPHPEVEGLTMLIGHGPFVFKEWKPGEYVRLVRYENYWRSLEQ